MALSCLFFWIPLEIKIPGANKHLRDSFSCRSAAIHLLSRQKTNLNLFRAVRGTKLYEAFHSTPPAKNLCLSARGFFAMM
jgi:hypothetical protein